MPSSSSSRRRRGRRGGRRGRKQTMPTPLEAAQKEETRNWAELPLDAISVVLHKLDHIDILMGAGLVCRSWLCAAKDDPALWRRIDMRYHADLFNQVDLHEMAKAAVRRSAGQCEAFWGEYAGDDDFLLYLGEQAPSFKSLRLISCYDVSNEGFGEAIQKFPYLRSSSFHLAKMFLGRKYLRLLGKHVHS